MDENKKTKEKKPKVVIRKCHHCKKPLEEGKNFCLHCGHTYTEEDPHAAEKKEKKKKFLIKLAIRLGILLGILAIIAVAVIIIVNEVNKSAFLRMADFIKSEGKFVEGVIPEGEETETELDSEPEDEESVEDAEGLNDLDMLEDESDLELESDSESEIQTEAIPVEPERAVERIERFNRYEYKLNKTTTLVCLEDEEHRFFMVYEDTVENFYTKIVIELDETTPNEYLWKADVSYDDPSPIGSQFDFVREYHGTFDPNKITSYSGDVEVEEKEEISSESEELDSELSTEEESESESEIESELESESQEDEKIDGEEGEEGEDEEDDEPQIPPEQAIENAALKMVSLQVREMISGLVKCLEENNIYANIGDLGFSAYFEYLESLDPLKKK